MVTRKLLALPLVLGALSAAAYFWRTPQHPVHTLDPHSIKATVQIYSKASCTYCVQAKDLLRGKGAPFEEIELDRTQPERRMEMMQRTGGKMSVPQIFINNHHIGGYSELTELDYEGKLDGMLLAGPEG